MALKTFRLCKELIIVLDDNRKETINTEKSALYPLQPILTHFSECKECKKNLIDLYDNQLSENISFMMNTLINNLLINKIREEI